MCVIRPKSLSAALVLASLLLMYKAALAEAVYPPLVLAHPGGRLEPLLLVRKPAGTVEYQLLEGLFINRTDIRLISGEKLQALLEKGTATVEEKGHLLRLYYSTSGSPYLVIEPVRYNQALFRLSTAAYRRLATGLYIAPYQPWIMAPPLGPETEAVIASYRSVGNRLLFEALYRVEGSMLAAAAARQSRAAGSPPPELSPDTLYVGGSVEGWLSDLVPWDSTKPSHGSLGGLVGNGRVVATGYSWSRNDTFIIPPRATRYEIWLDLYPEKACRSLVRAYLDGKLVIDVGVDDREVLAGIIVHAYPESPGNYLSHRLVRFRVELVSLCGEPTKMQISIHVYARSYVGRNDPFIYRQAEGFYGQAFSYDAEPAEKLRIYLPSSGSLTIPLPLVPPLLDDDGGKLVLVLHGGTHSSKHVDVYLGSSLVCSGSSTWNPRLKLQEYQCTVPPWILRKTITSFMKLGEAVPLKVSIEGGAGGSTRWWLEPFTLEVMSRPRRGIAARIRDVTFTRSSLLVSSYPVSSPNYFDVVLGLLDGVQVSHHPGRGLSAEYAGILAHAAAFLSCERPMAGSSYPAKVEETIYAAGFGRQPSYYGSGILGLASADVISIEGELTVRAIDMHGRALCLTGGGVEASKIGEGSHNKRLERVLNVAGWALGSASLLVSGTWATLTGIAAQIISLPSIFYSGKDIHTSASPIAKGDCVAGYRVEYSIKPSWPSVSLGRRSGADVTVALYPPLDEATWWTRWPPGAVIEIRARLRITMADYGDFEGVADDARPFVIEVSRSYRIPLLEPGG